MGCNSRSARSAVPTLVLAGSLSLALLCTPVPLAAQEADLDLPLLAPMEWEVEEAVEVLRRYLAVQEAERAAAAARDPFASELDDELPGPSDPRHVTAASAPGLGNASLAISDQLHLADASAVFKAGVPFLWDDAVGNLVLGRGALAISNGTAQRNTAIGVAALQNTNGLGNTAIGHQALQASTDASDNTAAGAGALRVSTGTSNTAIGAEALALNQLGGHNTATGAFALGDNTIGNNNTAVGRNALLNNVSGNNNVAIGFQAGLTAPPSASNNIFIAHQAAGDESTPTIRIGTDGTQTRAFIAGVHLGTLAGSAVHEVCVDDVGQLGACPTISSRRFKQDVAPLRVLHESLLSLEPVSFRYREGVLGGPEALHFGLIAEQVAEVLPELVTRDADGAPFAVRYELLSVLLLGELQRQVAADTRQQEDLELLRRRVAALEQRADRGARPVAEDGRSFDP